MLLFSIALAAIIGHVTAKEAVVNPRLSPAYHFAFTSPLHIPEVKKPKASYTNPQNQVPIDFYEIESRPFTYKFFPNLPGESSLLGYDGTFPGPTLRVEKGRQTVVRVVNKGLEKMNLHLHGSYSRSVFDGFAQDLISTGEYKDYFYPNTVARTLWYHDHTSGKNAVNMYKGLAGMYQIVDAALDASLGIPSGTNYDIPIVLTSHYFRPDGSLSDESKASTSTYGDTFLVNGQIQPYLIVEPRKYRFRMLNAAVSRVFNLAILDGKTPVSMAVVGSDGGMRQAPVATNNLIMGMADRWEVIIDFALLSGKNVTLTTKNMWTDTAYAGIDEVLRFVVSGSVTDGTDNAPISNRFRVDIKFPSDIKVAAERTFDLKSHMDMMWGLNSYHMDDPMSRVMMRPPLGTVEKYTFKSSGMGMSTGGKTSSSDPLLKPAGSSSGNMGGMHGGRGLVKRQMGMMMGGSGSGGMMSMADAGWTHAMHLHLVDMKLVARRKADPSKAEGRDYLEDYEKDSIKDVVLLGSNEVVEVLAKFQPYPGVYMFHCHNAVHEDKGMMGIFNVTKLADLGYAELEPGLEDPLDSRFSAKPYKGTNLEDIRSRVLPFFAGLNAYPDPAKLAEMEDRYWSTRTPPSGDETGPSVKPGNMMGMGGSGKKTLAPPILNPTVPTPTPPTPPPPPSASTEISGSKGMGGMNMGGAGMAGMNMGSAPAPGGATTCSPHNSHHGGCKRDVSLKKRQTLSSPPTTPSGGMTGMNGMSDMGGTGMIGSSTLGGATGCDPHNSHHGGCKRQAPPIPKVRDSTPTTSIPPLSASTGMRGMEPNEAAGMAGSASGGKGGMDMTPGGAIACDPHKSHHGGCRRR